MMDGALSMGDFGPEEVTWLNGREFVELQNRFWFRRHIGDEENEAPKQDEGHPWLEPRIFAT